MVFLVAILRLIQNSLHTISVEVSFTMANNGIMVIAHMN